MDRLLEKLRQNMAELSIQGDDFTRQIWHMYATFEEFIDNYTSLGEGCTSNASNTKETSKRNELVVEDANKGVSGQRHRIIGGSALELTNMAASTSSAQDINTCSKDDMSLFYRKPQHMCHYRRRQRRSDLGNPLLETISAIQDVCETDYPDFSEPSDQYYGSVRDHRSHPFKLCYEGDKDCIGYAGSNSIDSGYKSSCPTPEPSDNLLYSNDLSTKRGSFGHNSQKPKIPMGTKVMNRHSHPQYQGKDLEHLIYLRQSILSAMQRYEQETVVSYPHISFRPRSSSASSPGYRSASPSPCHSSSPLPQRRPMMASCPSSRTHSPCYSSASNGSGKSSPCYHRSRLVTAEEDIDTLLYGRVDELSCSYVTMIEDKYRRSSIAQVKKLKEKGIGPECSSSSESSCASPTTQSPLASGRFSEVAKCMLEIIEDLQTKGDGSPPNQYIAPTSTSTMTTSTIEPDYHVYEEITYDMPFKPRTESTPPPLPARPQGGFTRPLPQTHRPKQRSKLYSLFREPITRKDVSHSFELDSRKDAHARRAVSKLSSESQIETKENEYGFTMSNK